MHAQATTVEASPARLDDAIRFFQGRSYRSSSSWTALRSLSSSVIDRAASSSV